MSARTLLALISLLVIALSWTGCASWSESNPQIYDPRADGEQQLKEALQVAKSEQKRVLLNLGANWCSDSQGMFQLFSTNDQIRRVIQAHYVFEMVDVNKKGLTARNSRIVERYGNPIDAGIPVLLILDSNGQLLNTVPGERLVDSDHQHPTIVLAYLQKWATASPTPAP